MKIKALSIRKKITYGFGVLLILISATALYSYLIVHQVENKIVFVETIDNFLNMTIEMRRYEKNYFLYQHETDYQNCLTYIDRLEKIFSSHSELLISFIPVDKDWDIRKVLLAYKENMTRLHGQNQMAATNEIITDHTTLLQDQIRESGQKLTKIAEIVAQKEWNSIKKLLKTSRTVPIISTVILILTLGIGTMSLGKKIISSLKLLENYTSKVAEGGMIDPPKKWVEKEIYSLFKAFTRMNYELQLRQRQIVQSEKLASLGTLLAGVAHELNNPLSNISSSVQILEEELNELKSEFHKTLIKQIGEQTDKARDIVRTLLEFSRSREFKKESLHFNALIDDTLKLIQSDIPPCVELHVEYNADVRLFADRQRMQQVFINLIKNAVDAVGETGNIRIRVGRIFTAKEDMQFVEILVEDDGSGIYPAILPNIFDPFFTTKDIGHGSGLGLSIVHEIINMHNGEIRVESQQTEGTTFIICLPVKGNLP